MAMTEFGRQLLDELRQKDPSLKGLPWGGRCPRVLTRSYKLFKLRNETTTIDEERDVSEEIKNG